MVRIIALLVILAGFGGGLYVAATESVGVGVLLFVAGIVLGFGIVAIRVLLLPEGQETDAGTD